MTVFASLVNLTVCLQQMLKMVRLRLECKHQTLCYVCTATLLVLDIGYCRKPLVYAKNRRGKHFFVSSATLVTRTLYSGRLRLKCDGTHAETRFRLSAKRTSPFKSEGASVQSTTGSRSARISASYAGYHVPR